MSEMETEELAKILSVSETQNEFYKSLQDLMNLEQNLEAKTDLDKKEVRKIALLKAWAKMVDNITKNQNTSQIVDTYLSQYMKLKVSKNRLGRKEIIKALMKDVQKDERIDKLYKLLS